MTVRPSTDRALNNPVHTPGPWEAEVFVSDHGGWKQPSQNVHIFGNRRLLAAYDTSAMDYPDDAVNAANARLMAAAPDLLAACEAALNDRMFKEWPGVAALLKAAIAKAKGE